MKICIRRGRKISFADGCGALDFYRKGRRKNCMTRVLDIDLDFFLADVCPFADEGMRPDVQGCEPWPVNRVEAFLENRCLLDKKHPIPGRVFETHDGALFFWRDMIGEGMVTLPFSVTHVDAHTDLGVAQRGYPYVKHNVLGRPVEKRCDFDAFRAAGQLNEANYLLFAIASRWVHDMTNVRNIRSLRDMPADVLTDRGIHLKSAFPQLFEFRYGEEPYVAYAEFANPDDFWAEEKFDVMSLAISPRYSPKEADKLIEVIMQYARPR